MQWPPMNKEYKPQMRQMNADGMQRAGIEYQPQVTQMDACGMAFTVAHPYGSAQCKAAVLQHPFA